MKTVSVNWIVSSCGSSGLNQTIPSDNIMGSGDGFAQLALMWGAQLLACSGKLLQSHYSFRGLWKVKKWKKVRSCFLIGCKS